MKPHDEHPTVGLAEILAFIAKLDSKNIHYTLASYRKNALMVTVAVPGERWEIEYMDDGTVQIERFRSDGNIGGRDQLDELWSLCD